MMIIVNKDKMGKIVWMNQCLRIEEEARRKKLTNLINAKTDELIYKYEEDDCNYCITQFKLRR